MRPHLVYKFEEIKATNFKRYWKVQIDEQMYMALRIIKQGGGKKAEVYYECILKLVNCFEHQAYDSLLTTFFRLGLQPYF